MYFRAECDGQRVEGFTDGDGRTEAIYAKKDGTHVAVYINVEAA